MSSNAWRQLQEQLKTNADKLPEELVTRQECTVPESVGVHIINGLVNGESLQSIIRDLPGITSGMVYWWLSGGQTGGAAGVLAANYARARAAQAARLGQQSIEIVDEAAQGRGDHRSQRVALDGARWMTSRLDRTTWGERVDVQHSGSVTLDAIVTEAAQQRRSVLDKARGRVIEGEAEDVTPEDGQE